MSIDRPESLLSKGCLCSFLYMRRSLIIDKKIQNKKKLKKNEKRFFYRLYDLS